MSIEKTDELVGSQTDTQLLEKPAAKAKRPSFFKVVLLNDDYTPMDFVVEILKDVYRKGHEEAIAIMTEVHQKGSAICGIYTRDVAETKAELTVTVAKRHEYPLQCLVEMA